MSRRVPAPGNDTAAPPEGRGFSRAASFVVSLALACLAAASASAPLDASPAGAAMTTDPAGPPGPGNESPRTGSPDLASSAVPAAAEHAYFIDVCRERVRDEGIDGARAGHRHRVERPPRSLA